MSQPPPVHVPGAASVHDLVVADLDGRDGCAPLVDLMLERRAVGLATYGTVLTAEEPNRSAAVDALEELADAIAYAKRGALQGVPGMGDLYAALVPLTAHFAAQHRKEKPA